MAEEGKKSFLGELFNELKYEVLFDVGKNIVTNKFGKKAEDIAGVFSKDGMQEIGANELEIANLEGDITRRMLQKQKGNSFFGLVKLTSGSSLKLQKRRGKRFPKIKLSHGVDDAYDVKIAEAEARIKELKAMNDEIKKLNTKTDTISIAERNTTMESNKEKLKKEKMITRKEELLEAREEQIRELEHEMKLNKLKKHASDPDFKTVDDLKNETDLAKAKFELKVEQNKLDEIMGVRINAHALLKKQTEEAELKAKLANSEYELAVAEAKKNNGLVPNPNQDLLDQITRTELEAKLATANATLSNAALLAAQQARPDLTPAQIGAINRLMVMIENQVTALLNERQGLTRRQNFMDNQAILNRLLAIDQEITRLWAEFQALIDRLRNI